MRKTTSWEIINPISEVTEASLSALEKPLAATSREELFPRSDFQNC
jgi:hypothetical protein